MKHVVLTLGIAFIAATSFGQKSNIVNAVMAYNDFHENVQNMDQAKKDIIEAKTYIDKAIAHPDTKESAKALMYQGKIYIEMSAIVESAKEDEAFKGMDTEKMVETGFNALKKSKEVDSKGKYIDDVNAYADQYRVASSNMGITAYGEEKYEVAMAGLLGAAKFGDIMGLQDSMFYFFGGQAAYVQKEWEVAEEAFAKCVALDYNTAESIGFLAKSMKEQGKNDEAEKVLTDAVTNYPENLDVLIQMTNFYIDNDRTEDAEKALSAAIKLDPSNTALVYTSGIIYESMERYDDAEAAYKKTMELDPNHNDSKYSLGVFYFNRGADMNNQANKLDFGDPSYDTKVAASKEFFKQALPYLEQSSAAQPKDIQMLESLKAVYGKLSMTDKFMETKAKITELKG